MANQGFTSPINPHFFQPLLPGFPNHFIIPVKFFLKHIEGKNENSTAKLRSDISHKTWKVKLDGRRFTDGWEDFAANHDFRVGDIVFFRQEGDMVFHVTGFGPSCCNLQYDITGNIYREKNMEKNSRTEAGSPSNHSCFVAHVTVSNLRVDTLRIPSSFAKSNGLNKRCCEIVLMNEHGRSWTLYLRYKKSSDTTYIIRGWRSFCHANGQNVGSFFTLKLVRNGITPELQFSSTECGNNCSLEKHSGAKEMTINSKKRNSEDGSSSGACSKRLPLRFTRANEIKSGKITILDKY